MFNEMVDILTNDADGYEKRAEASEYRKKTNTIKDETSKYFDCVDGIRNELEHEMKYIYEQNAKLNRAEQSIKRLRDLADAIMLIKSVTPKKEIDVIQKKMENIKIYMERHLSYGK